MTECLSTNIGESLSLLEQLTLRLPIAPTRAISIADKRHYNVKTGNAIFTGLMKEKQCAVALAELSAGTEFYGHVHKEEKNWLILIEGDLAVCIDEKEFILSPGDGVYVDKGQPHSVKCNSAARILTITIPADRGFPNVIRK